MTITYVAAGALATGTTTVSPAHPAGIATGDLEILTIVSGHPNESLPGMPAGWSLIGTMSGGGGAFGSGTGPRRLTLLARVAASSNPVPAVTLPTGAGATLAARMVAYHRSAGTGWRYSSSLGEMTAASTAFSALGADPLTYATNDWVHLAYGLRSNTSTATAQGVAAGAAVFGARTERADDAVATGNLSGLMIATCSVTTGTASTLTAPTITETLTVALTGVGAAVRIREATTAIVAAAQTADPPRNLVSVTGMLAEEIVTATLERLTGTDVATLRGADSIDVTGQDALVRPDGEFSFGLAVTYRATLIDLVGESWQITSNTLTTNIVWEILSDATQAAGVPCKIRTWQQRDYAMESSQFNVNGRIVTVSGPLSEPVSTLVVRTVTLDERDMMLALLRTATNGILLIRTHTSGGLEAQRQIDGYLQLTGRITESIPVGRAPERDWAIEVIGSEPWPLTIEARGFTLGSIYDYYAGAGTLQALADQFAGGSLLSIAQFDWSI